MGGAADITPEFGSTLRAIADAHPTPLYVYDLDAVANRIGLLREAFGRRLEISYAVKANPNRLLLQAIASRIERFDASSYSEVERISDIDATKHVTFTGPGKRDDELFRFASRGTGELVVESMEEARSLSRIVAVNGLPRQSVIVRIGPHRIPRHFGASMSSRRSQFGIDEEEMEAALRTIAALPGVAITGFHCFSGTNCLNASAIVENFGIMLDLFRRGASICGIEPETLIFGSGFGVPYFEGEAELDLTEVAAAVGPLLDALKAEAAFAKTQLVLELGRWLAGPAGYLLTSVIRSKVSRGTAIGICDAGFNTNMAACGMLGGVFRRNWRIRNLSNPDGAPQPYDLVGPLCTTLDQVATSITLPQVRTGDVLVIPCSGAYGLTASPTRFISHPEPKEVVIDRGKIRDATESRLNWWSPLAPQTEMAS